MSIRKLLATASAVALLPMGASAIDITFVGTGQGGTTAADVPASANTMTLDPASEVDFTDPTAYAGNLSVEINNETGDYPQGTALRVTVNLPTGVRTSAAFNAGTNVTAGADGVAGVSSTSSGGVNASTVSFLYTANAPGDENIGVTIPIRVVDCAGIDSNSLNVNVVVDASGTAIDGGTGTLAANTIFSDCESALAVVTVPADATLSSDSGFNSFGTAMTPNAAGNVGTVDFNTIDRDVNLAGETFADADVLGAEFDIVVGDASAFSGITVGGEAPTSVSGNTFSYVLDSAAATALFNAGASDVIVTLDDTTAPNAAQGPILLNNIQIDIADDASAATLTAPLVSPQTLPAQTLGSIVREGATFGPFDWVSDTRANSVFRLTGMPDGAVPMTVTTTNSSLGMAGNKLVTGSVTAVNGELVLTSLSGLGVGATGYGRADVTLSFETSAGLASNIDVDRLVVSNGSVYELGSANLAAGDDSVD